MIDLSEIGPKAKDHEAYHYIEDYEGVGLLRRIINRGGEGSGHFGHLGRPGERGGSQPGDRTSVGITSQHSEEGGLGPRIVGERQLRTEMDALRRELTDAGVPGVRVSMGRGGYQGGWEQSFVLSYKGTSTEAKRVLAMASARWGQNALLLMEPPTEGNTQAASDFTLTFDGALKNLDAIARVEKELSDARFQGWTWTTRGGKPVLQLNSVPQWGGTNEGHAKMTADLEQRLTTLGVMGERRDWSAAVTVVGDKEEVGYQSFLNSLAERGLTRFRWWNILVAKHGGGDVHGRGVCPRHETHRLGDDARETGGVRGVAGGSAAVPEGPGGGDDSHYQSGTDPQDGLTQAFDYSQSGPTILARSALAFRGGEGSGHFGHKGRPGERGGSAPGEDGGQDSGSREFRENQKALVTWVDENWATIKSALDATKWSEVKMASPWMAPNGGIHDTGKTGIRHHQGVLDAFAGSGVWDEESVRSADEAEGDTYTVLSEFMEHGFVGISVDFGGKTYSIRFTDPKDITRGQREALAADVLIAMRQGYTIQAEPSRIGKGPDYYDENEVLRLLGIERVGRTVERGGPGSGFFAHAGRPGFRGGSLPGEGGERRYMADKDPWPTAYRVRFPIEFSNFSTQRGYQNATMWGWVNTKYGSVSSHEGPMSNGHESLAPASAWASRGLFGYYRADIPILVVYATDTARGTSDVANAVGNLDAILQAVEYPDDLPLPVLAVSDDAGYSAHRVRIPQLEARGGPGSGHFGHLGRPGERGGSQPGDDGDGRRYMMAGGERAAGLHSASQALKVPRTEKWKPVRDALEAIDSVHGIDGVPLNVKLITLAATAQSAGHLRVERGPGHFQVKNVSLRILPEGETPDGMPQHLELTTAHEFAHLMDWTAFQEIQKSGGDWGDYDKPMQGSRAVWYLGAENEAMYGVMNAIKESEAYAALNVESMPYRAWPGGTVKLVYDSETMRYLREPEELFARAYAQYIATRSGNELMLRAVDDLRAGAKDGHPPMAWEDKDYQAIAAAFDTMFDQRGWR